jgi:hypothetical protein
MDVKEFQETKTRLNEKIKAFQEVMLKEGKDLFRQMSQTLFEENPNLGKFGWKQYTPYYNDGDECVFSAYSDYPIIKLISDTHADDGYRDDFDEEQWFTEEETTPEAIAWKNVKKFLEQFSDEDFKLLFGDHVEVVVTRDGVEVNEYSHD